VLGCVTGRGVDESLEPASEGSFAVLNLGAMYVQFRDCRAQFLHVGFASSHCSCQLENTSRSVFRSWQSISSNNNTPLVSTKCICDRGWQIKRETSENTAYLHPSSLAVNTPMPGFVMGFPVCWGRTIHDEGHTVD
jgi:hypothetical protein